MPRKFGWPSGKPSRPPPVAGIAKTGRFCFSANWTAMSQAPDASMSGPAIITGFEAFSSESARASIASGSGAGAPATSRAIT